MLTIESLIVKYEGNAVLNGVDLQLSTAQVHGLVGLNGAGKTTLLNVLYGFVKPQQGKVLWGGAALSRKKVAYLETHNFFYEGILAKDHLALFRSKWDDTRFSAWVELLQLPLEQEVAGFSTGMKKKLALLSILMLEKEIVVLDEPFNGLDLETVHLLKKVIGRLREEGKTVLITSHILETMLQTCDHIHHLAAGKITQSYTKPEFPRLSQELEGMLSAKTDVLLGKAFGNGAAP